MKIKLKWRTDDNAYKKNTKHPKPSVDKRTEWWYIQQWALFFKTQNLNDWAKYFSDQSVNKSLHG